MMQAYGANVILTKLERERDSGILVVGDHGEIKDGIVESVGEDVPHLQPGDKVHYLSAHALQVGDRTYTQFQNVLAYEAETRS